MRFAPFPASADDQSVMEGPAPKVGACKLAGRTFTMSNSLLHSEQVGRCYGIPVYNT